MKVIYGLKKIKKFRQPVVALGVFDGVHIGHRRILQGVVKKAKAIKGTSIAVTFWPHPQKEESLYSLEHRLRLIAELGIDICLVIKFDKRFARVSAQDFIRDILVKKIGCRYIYIGRNFRFGRHATGDFRLLAQLSCLFSFQLKAYKILKANRRQVSSTYIRNLIKRGKLDAAKKLLGRPVSILGSVIRGSLLARKLGFPTANIDPHHEILPPSGVYAIEIIFNCKKFYGACYIGRKPTFLKSGLKVHIETHIFNFRKNIYGRNLEVRFVKKIRNERIFSSALCLSRQIKKDLAQIKSIFSSP